MFKFDGTVFNWCGVVNSLNAPSSAIILNQSANVKNCIFNDCWGYSHAEFAAEDDIDPVDERRTLFAKGSVDEGNVITNSASFCEK